MSGKKIWFGNTQHAQWVPCPAVGLTVRRLQYAASLDYENSGGDEVRAVPWRMLYDLDFPLGYADDYEGIEAFGRFLSGEYGTDYLRFVDPMYSDLNLFNAVWAAPGLIEQGWRNFGPNTPAYSNLTASAYKKPPRKATWTLTGLVANAVLGKAFTILVPAGYTLSLGATGSQTGNGRLMYKAGAAGTPTAFVMIADTTAPAFSITVNGGTDGTYVTVYMTLTSAGASTVTLGALWAQIRKTGVTATIARHFPGEGHEGLRFRGADPIPRRYTSAPRHLVGMAGTQLVETEPWALG